MQTSLNNFKFHEFMQKNPLFHVGICIYHMLLFTSKKLRNTKKIQKIGMTQTK